LRLLVKSNVIKKIIIIFLPFLSLTFCLFQFKNRVDFNNYPTIFEFFYFIIIIIYYFFEKLNTVGFTPIYNKISFWIAVGLFFYFTGNFFYILLVENSRNESIQVKNQLIIMYSVVTIIKNLILGLAFLVGKDEDDNANNFIPFPSDLDLDATTPNQ